MEIATHEISGDMAMNGSGKSIGVISELKKSAVNYPLLEDLDTNKLDVDIHMLRRMRWVVLLEFRITQSYIQKIRSSW